MISVTILVKLTELAVFEVPRSRMKWIDLLKLSLLTMMRFDWLAFVSKISDLTTKRAAIALVRIICANSASGV